MTDAIAAKSPWHLWLVGALSFLWNTAALVFAADAFMRGEPPEVSHIAWLVGAAAGTAGAILLLMKRPAAVGLLAVAFLSTIVSLLLPFVLEEVANADPLVTVITITVYALGTGLPYLYARGIKASVLR